jgi:hypothetical protein
MYESMPALAIYSPLVSASAYTVDLYSNLFLRSHQDTVEVE